MNPRVLEHFFILESIFGNNLKIESLDGMMQWGVPANVQLETHHYTIVVYLESELLRAVTDAKDTEAWAEYKKFSAAAVLNYLEEFDTFDQAVEALFQKCVIEELIQ